MGRISTVIATLCLLASASSLSAQGSEYNEGAYRVGIGQEVTESLNLGARLPSIPSGLTPVMGARCALGSRLSVTSGRDVTSVRELLISMEIDTLFPARGNLMCGSREITARTYLENLTPDGWRVVAEPSIRVMRFYTSRYAKTVLDRDGSRINFEKTEIGFKMRFGETDRERVSCGYIQEGFACSYQFENNQHRSDMRVAFQSLGYSIIDNPNIGDRILINFGRVNPNDFVRDFRKKILLATPGYSLLLGLSIKRQEQGFGERLRPGWQRREAEEAFFN